MWISDKSIARLAKALNLDIFQLFMPHNIKIIKIDMKENSVLLEFWQETKLAVRNLDSQIDYEFKDVLKHSNHHVIGENATHKKILTRSK